MKIKEILKIMGMFILSVGLIYIFIFKFTWVVNNFILIITLLIIFAFILFVITPKSKLKKSSGNLLAETCKAKFTKKEDIEKCIKKEI